MKGSKIYESSFHDTAFNNCNLSESKFRIMTDGHHGNVSFTKCNLDKAKIDIETGHAMATDSYYFRNCSMHGTNMSGCDFSKNKLTVKDCDTKDAKFMYCKVHSLECCPKFKYEFLIKGGEITAL